MGKNKLARWAEMETFDNVIQPGEDIGLGKSHPIKGKWRSEFFHNQNPLILELGCGRGEYTIGLAEKFLDKNYIGIDIKGARIWRGAKTAYERKMSNVGFLRTRIEFINSFFGENEVDEIWLTFPDPYPGKRNSNKRLNCPWFLNNYRNFLKDNGIIHLKTDNSELFYYTKNIAECNDLQIIAENNDLYSEKPENDIFSIRTHYEDLFLKDGLKIHYLSFRLEKNRLVEDVSKKIKRKY